MSPESAAQIDKLEAQLVVLGGGGAGLAAAVAAAELGVTDTVVLEKRGRLGGNSARATGLFACESPVQAREMIVADRDEIFKKAMDWAHWSRVNPRIFRAFIDKSGDTIRWLEEKGLDFHVIAFFPNQTPRVEHVAQGKGAQLTQILTEQCRKLGVGLLMECSGSSILRATDGRVTGVKALKESRALEISAKAVIVATGGFGGNIELLKKYCPAYYEGMPLRGWPLTGDGLLMAAEAGAAIDDVVTLLKEGPRIDPHTWPLKGLEREACTLWVNNKGERFVDEATGAHPFEAVNAILRQPDRLCYTLLDDTVRKKMEEKTPGLKDSIQGEAANGRANIAESWDQIAAWIGARAEALGKTVHEYNACCDRGCDEIFAKDRRYLFPLRQPPFYALRGQPHFLDTLGGIIINERMEVLDTQHQPIPGLFAAGVATSGWESEAYCSDLSGSAFGYAINSGRIAGENAAKSLIDHG